MSASISAGYELSPQQKLFFLQNRCASVAGLALLLEGAADPAKVRSAVQALVERHEILRTRFQRRSGMKFPFQVISEDSTFAWDEIDLTASGTNEQQEHIAGLLSGSSKIDVEHGPVLHARFAKLGQLRHTLVLSASALCADDASLNRILADFASFYAEAPAGDVLQYADYSEWQNEFLASQDDDAKQAASFWERTEFDSLPSLSIPFERKPAATESSWQRVPVNPTSSSAAKSADFLFASWQTFLARISGRHEFVTGLVSDGRNRDEFAEGIGLFSRILPIRADFTDSGTFSTCLKQAEAAISAALNHQDYFSVDRITQRVPVGFISLDAAAKTASGNLEISEIGRLVPSPSFRLQLRREGTNVFLEYETAYFSRETIAALTERFEAFLQAASVNPESSWSALPIMSAHERQLVVTGFNKTSAEYPKEKCIHELFEQQTALHPDRPALRFGEQELTYAELNREANRIAHVLRQHGVTNNVPVALCLERSAEMITALIGILKAGGCYLPLIPDNPKPRLAYQLSEAGSPIILTAQKHLNNLPAFAGNIICLDRDRGLLDAAPDGNPATNSSPHDLVYVIYTSGSTGTPKGVAVRHFNLVNYSHFICERLKLDGHPSGLNFATVSTISADLGNTCIFPSLISGGCLHVIGYETAMSPALFAAYATHHPIDVLKITPSQLSSLIEGEAIDRVLPRKYLILGGEATRWEFVERIREANKCRLLNHYGPTEATVGCCTFFADTDVSAWEPSTLPIGKPIGNDEIYVLDAHSEPLPIGVAGELCIGGTGLAQGYLNQPQQTAERFVRNPFSSDAGSRLYKTGDLARFLPDGNIEFLGRIDSQVKIRGFRVEPAEIESVLKQHPAVGQAAVVSYEAQSEGEKKLAAYIVARSASRAEDFRAFLIQQLPEYMVPSAFVCVESLPLTANGKLDVRALPAPEQQAPVRESVAPRNPDEQKLAQIWQEVLKREQVGVTDNFFEIGGHSLLATQIISRIRNGFRVQMPLHAFLQSPTIAALAEQIPRCPPVESEQEEMARLLQELEGISDEEAERLLAADTHKDSGGRR